MKQQTRKERMPFQTIREKGRNMLPKLNIPVSLPLHLYFICYFKLKLKLAISSIVPNKKISFIIIDQQQQQQQQKEIKKNYYYFSRTNPARATIT